MRLVAPILMLFALLACARAQQQESEMWNRLNSRSDRAIEAMKNRDKEYSDLAHPMMSKSFQDNNKSIANKTAGVGTFSTGKKMTADNYTTRSFLGIKNPWFGRKVVEPKTASLWSKSALPNADKKVDAETVKVTDFYQTDKKLMNRDAETPTKPFLGRGAVQGAIDAETANAKNMTIDEVRDLLNKSKTRKQAQAQAQQ